MKLIRDLNDLPAAARSGAVSVGNFDGVHLGHARIAQRLIAAARDVRGPAVAFTFNPHPAMLLRPDRCPAPLTTIDRRAELLAELGVDVVVAYPTDQPLLRLTAREFFDRILRSQLDARAIVEGPNFCFGRDRLGTIETLREFAAKDGVAIHVVEPVVADGNQVSSSAVRRLISQGDVAAAQKLLTQPYRITGTVARGAGRGATIGFPTANLTDVATLLPALGVYGGAAQVANRRWPAAINLGPNPTFGETAVKVEVHLIGFTGSLYHQPLAVDFRQRIRDVQTFPNVDALKQQLREDVRRVVGGEAIPRTQ